MYARQKIEHQLREGLKSAAEKACQAGDFSLNGNDLPEIELEIPREREFGDYATNLAMQLPKIARKAPRQIAEALVTRFEVEPGLVEAVEIAGPGFINFRLDPQWLGAVVAQVNEMGKDYGRTDKHSGKTYNLEFISANPTGPMHMGNARGGAIGDVLASLADWTGYDVTREFYINDAGNQIEKFGDSLDARFRQQMGEDFPFPEDGYQGDDIGEHIREYLQANPDQTDALKAMEPEQRKKIFIDYALNKNLDRMHKDLADYGIHYDVWFSEQSLYETGAIEKAMDLLKKSGSVYEEDGAVWFRTTDYGCEKDDVLIRHNGIPTYFMGDIAYHLNKFETRGFDRGVNVWGADHHGHIARLKAALEAAGAGDKLDVVIMQLVKLVQDGEIVKMSKRTGKMITLTDLIEMIGKDAARFFFNLRSPDSHFEFDLDLAVQESNENPVFYVQYAHARICSILRQAEGFDWSGADLSLLKEPEEVALMEVLSRFYEEIQAGEEKMDPSRITRYAVDLASAFHSFYNAVRVNTDEVELKKARFALVSAVRQVLENASVILGINAPERM
ncbi:MAG: arginine--tRNA ligase [Eubacteriaceae bacterium]|jgi:arginyl-tRNA synthetase